MSIVPVNYFLAVVTKIADRRQLKEGFEGEGGLGEGLQFKGMSLSWGQRGCESAQQLVLLCQQFSGSTA